VCAGAAVGAATGAAAAVALTGLAGDARAVLHFDFHGVERTPQQALSLAGHNAKLAGGALLCALVAPQLASRVRACVDALLAALFIVNAAIIGIAIAAYGHRVAQTTALHLPLELLAFSLAGAAYLSARRTPLRANALAAVAGLCASLLLVAAVVETYRVGGLR
jgi:hypothetical protein